MSAVGAAWLACGRASDYRQIRLGGVRRRVTLARWDNTGERDHVIGREFIKKMKLLNGRSETIMNRYEMDKAGRLVEHVQLETHDRPKGTLDAPAPHGVRRPE
jgi:hypothetical protein